MPERVIPLVDGPPLVARERCLPLPFAAGSYLPPGFLVNDSRATALPFEGWVISDNYFCRSATIRIAD